VHHTRVGAPKVATRCTVADRWLYPWPYWIPPP
jgi:hypothetical protein